MTQRTLTTDEARSALDRLTQERTNTTAELAVAREALDTLERTSGDRLLAARLAEDETAAASIRSELTEARAAVADLEAIATAADRAIEAAQRDVLAVEATEARNEALQLWGEAESRLQKTNRLLDELADHEGARFVPPPHVEPSGAIDPTRYATTKTGELVGKILDCERRASALEIRAGRTPAPSLLADRIQSVPGGPSTAATPPLRVTGGYLDAASAKLAGREIPKQEPSRDDIAKAARDRSPSPVWR